MSRLSVPENISLDTFFGEAFRVSGNLELNASFNFEGNTAGDFPFTMESNGSIRISAFLDYERKSSYVVHIKGQEGERAVLRQFTISIEDIFEMDLNEAPTDISVLPKKLKVRGNRDSEKKLELFQQLILI